MSQTKKKSTKSSKKEDNEVLVSEGTTESKFSTAATITLSPISNDLSLHKVKLINHDDLFQSNSVIIASSQLGLELLQRNELKLSCKIRCSTYI